MDSRKRVLVVLVVLIVAAGLVRSLPYIVDDPYFEVGFDTGYYEDVTRRYDSNDEWMGIPAYPVSPGSEYEFMSIEQGFFSVISFGNRVMQLDIDSMYRGFLPLLTSLMIIPVMFVLGRSVFRDSKVALMGSTFLAFSILQVDAVNESYYKQIFGLFLLLAAVWQLERFDERGDIKHAILFGLFGAGIACYERPTLLLFGILSLSYLALNLYRRRSDRYLSILASLLIGAAISVWAWLPTIGQDIDLLISVIEKSFWRSSTLISGEGLWEGGGAILEILRGYPHVLLGYLVVFPLTVVLGIFGAVEAYRRRLGTIPLLILLILTLYIGFWLFFGNRFIVEFDVLIALFAGFGLVTLILRLGNDERGSKVGKVVVVVVVAFLFFSIVGFQSDKEPYITENLQGVEWMSENIDVRGSSIFAPYILSADLIQMEYDMAVWDYSLCVNECHPSSIAEDFMKEAPTNLTYLAEFFESHPNYIDLELYVVWGESGPYMALPISQEPIPTDSYEGSPYFTLVYEGADEIYRIYEFDHSLMNH
jgi:hypothetical protein